MRGSWNGVLLEADPAGGPPAAVVAESIADERGVTGQQVALAWALAHSPAMLPIPGTSKLDHLDSTSTPVVELSEDEIALLESAVRPRSCSVPYSLT